MNWLHRIFYRHYLYEDLAAEMRAHLEERTEQIMRLENVSREQAERAAKKAFGNATLIEERSREAWQWLRIENLLRDLVFSARLLRKSPGFTLVAILIVALGVGANTAVFSLLNGLLLRPLPVPDAQRLVLLRMSSSTFAYSFSAPLFRAIEAHHETFENVYAFADDTLQVRVQNGIEKIPGALVSGQFFAAMETGAQLGRTLTAADDHKNAGGLNAVISDSFWKTHLNRAPDILGRPLKIGDAAFTIVGVMPKEFVGADADTRPQIYLPLSSEPIVDAPYDMLNGNKSWWLRVGARLKPGVSLEHARAYLNTMQESIFKEAIPDLGFEFPEGSKRDQMKLIVEPGAVGYSALRERFRGSLLATFVLCAALLLLACINLASLLLARTTARKPEIATRLAIGASRGRLVQQLLVDSLLLSILGAAAGLAAAPLASRGLVAMLTPANSVLSLNADLDWRVFLFATLTAIVCALLIGFLPALQATAGDLIGDMKGVGRSIQGERRTLLPKVLLGAEVAIAMVLVTGAGLLAASLVRLYRSGLGFDPHNLMLVDYDMGKQQLDGAPLIHLYRTIAERIAAQHGALSVAFVGVTPISRSWSITNYHLTGGMDRETYSNLVSPNYFRTMCIPVIGGRDFTWQDTPETSKKIILNQTAARIFFPSGSAIGQSIREKDNNKETTYEVIAVVGDAKYKELSSPAPPTAYLPLTQAEGNKPNYTAVVRFQGLAASLAATIRRITTELAPTIPSPPLDNMSQRIDASISAQRVMALLSLFFAASALVVTAIGLYGVLAYATARRTSEIGVRMALGAARLQVVALVFRENAWTTGIGCIAGLLGALATSRVLASFLYGTSPRDPWVLSLSLAILCVSCAAASLIPAIRAASIDPIQALRME